MRRNSYLTSRSKVTRSSLWYATHLLMMTDPHAKYLKSRSKDEKVLAQTGQHYKKFSYLTLRSKVKVTRRSLWYATHLLMMIHPHAKYLKPRSKDKKVMALDTIV